MSEATQMIPLELNLIDEGRFVKAVNDALIEAQQKLMEHVKRYGGDAEKAKAVVKAEIALVCMNPADMAFGCVAQIKTVSPTIPASANMLMGGTTQTGEERLLCRVSGAGKDHPDQNVLCKQDGSPLGVDAVTGEIEDQE